jgi:hypothetical protein
MYATAMYVRALDGSDGISLSLYSHARSQVQDYSNVEEIANGNPGQFVRSRGGGMNRSVLAFIDVTGPDGLLPDAFGEALRLVDPACATGLRSLHDPPRGVRWKVLPSPQDKTREILSALVAELDEFFRGGSVVASPGIEVLVEENDEGLTFSLAEPTKRRIQRTHPNIVLPTMLRISRDTLAAMDAAGRADFGTFASLVTGLGDDELKENDVVIVEPNTKKQVWRAK